jgi:DNA sulfur modification protein DndD
MIIKEIIISNYQCYFEDNRFEFTKGSNIILGKNGGGKTKFFECLEWLFDFNKSDVDELISKKKLAESENGYNFKVGVEITFQRSGTLLTAKKYFNVHKKENKEFSTTSVVYEGIIENDKGERDVTDGQQLLTSIFPPTNRRYCLFKGESELNILNNNEALKNLIGLYSKSKHYRPYSEKGAFFLQYADKQVEEATKKEKKFEKRYTELEYEIADVQRKIHQNETFLQEKFNDQRNLEENIQGVQKHLDNAEAVEIIKKRLAEIDDKIKRKEGLIYEDYTTALFDKNWLLIHFEKIKQEFSNKIIVLSESRRKEQSDHDKEEGIKEGIRRMKATLYKNVVPLPIDTPTRAIMEEMIKDEICKVCNREAKEGTEPYEFMRQRLTDFVETLEPVKEEDEDDREELFKHNYTSKLVALEAKIDNDLLKIRSINQEIGDLVEFNRERKEEIAQLLNDRTKEESDFENVIGSSDLGQDKLSSAFRNSKGWQQDLLSTNRRIEELRNTFNGLKKDLQVKVEEKESLDMKSASTYLTQTRKVIRDIQKIFNDTKEKKYDEFVGLLELNTNRYLKLINIGSFTGYVEIKRKTFNNNETVDVNLMQDGEIFYHPNTSLQTSMHLAILFAIAQMTNDEKEECYPMIFDAPTSSFDPIKRKHFFDVLGECNEQTILLTKDFTDVTGPESGLLYSDDFIQIKRDKAFLIKIEEPFDEEVLSTINTQVINL